MLMIHPSSRSRCAEGGNPAGVMDSGRPLAPSVVRGVMRAIEMVV
jgi:hypothetical protein